MKGPKNKQTNSPQGNQIHHRQHLDNATIWSTDHDAKRSENTRWRNHIHNTHGLPFPNLPYPEKSSPISEDKCVYSDDKVPGCLNTPATRVLRTFCEEQQAIEKLHGEIESSSQTIRLTAHSMENVASADLLEKRQRSRGTSKEEFDNLMEIDSEVLDKAKHHWRPETLGQASMKPL